MKIAFFTYPSAFQNPGGGEVQLLKTKEALEKEGLRIDFFDPWKSRIEDYDILHVFSSVKDCLSLMQVAKSRNVKVVTSSVLWSDWRRALFTDGGLRTKGDLFLRHFLKVACPAFPSSRRRVLMESDFIFPNSEAEKKQLQRLFAIPAQKIRVVPNGVDPEFASADPSLFRERYGREPFLLTVGRVEPRKNQLNLLKAVKKLGMRFYLIGSPVSGYENYFEACRKEGEGFAVFLPTLKHEDGLLRSAYAACEAFVLQAWFETPGLAALEAGLAGARVVATQGGSTREYFKDFVEYVDPSSPADICEKIKKALASPKNTVLKEYVGRNFTWDKVAKATLSHYRELLPGK